MKKTLFTYLFIFLCSLSSISFADGLNEEVVKDTVTTTEQASVFETTFMNAMGQTYEHVYKIGVKLVPPLVKIVGFLFVVYMLWLIGVWLATNKQTYIQMLAAVFTLVLVTAFIGSGLAEAAGTFFLKLTNALSSTVFSYTFENILEQKTVNTGSPLGDALKLNENIYFSIDVLTEAYEEAFDSSFFSFGSAITFIGWVLKLLVALILVAFFGIYCITYITMIMLNAFLVPLAVLAIFPYFRSNLMSLVKAQITNLWTLIVLALINTFVSVICFSKVAEFLAIIEDGNSDTQLDLAGLYALIVLAAVGLLMHFKAPAIGSILGEASAPNMTGTVSAGLTGAYAITKMRGGQIAGFTLGKVGESLKWGAPKIPGAVSSTGSFIKS